MAGEQSSIEPTALLKFIDGKLHQYCIVSENGESRPEWRVVPSEVSNSADAVAGD